MLSNERCRLVAIRTMIAYARWDFAFLRGVYCTCGFKGCSEEAMQLFGCDSYVALGIVVAMSALA